MKADIHPEYVTATVKCSCGNTFTTRSTQADLHVLVDQGAGVLARRAAAFDRPPTIWTIDGSSLHPAEPAPFLPEPPLDPLVAPLADVILTAGAEPVVEHGVLRGEVLGLEV